MSRSVIQEQKNLKLHDIVCKNEHFQISKNLCLKSNLNLFQNWGLSDINQEAWTFIYPEICGENQIFQIGIDNIFIGWANSRIQRKIGLVVKSSSG